MQPGKFHFPGKCQIQTCLSSCLLDAALEPSGACIILHLVLWILQGGGSSIVILCWISSTVGNWTLKLRLTKTKETRTSNVLHILHVWKPDPPFATSWAWHMTLRTSDHTRALLSYCPISYPDHFPILPRTPAAQLRQPANKGSYAAFPHSGAWGQVRAT